MTRRNPIFCIALAVSLSLALASFVRAQSPAQETLSQRTASGTTANPTLAPGVSSDSDLGEIAVVQRVPRPATITATTTQQFFYSDNVFFTNANQIGSTGYYGGYAVSYVPYSLRDWTPRVALQYNMVRYGNAAEGDFDNENLTVSSQYVFTEDRAWSWTAAINLSRFTAPHANDHEFYKEVVYDNQITHVQQLMKDTPLFFIAAYDLAYHQANPADFDRLDNVLSFSLAYYVLPSVSIGPYVRPAARTYFTNTANQNDRDDFNISCGLDVTWQVCEYAALSADVSHADNFSNNSGMSYDETTPSLSVTGTVKF